jgi:LysR family transcriptional regulator, hydrogen peroxide-inducible genes activator
MTNMTLKQLRYFEALAKQRHFGRAAALCAISQPALSVQIKELETQFGKALFERGAREVRLTAFGEEVSVRIRVILQGVGELSEFARAAQEGLAGQFRLGIIPTIAPYLLPRLIGGLAQDYPQMALNIRETLTARLVEELLDGLLDAAIVALPVSEPALTEMPLFSENFLLVRPQSEADMPVPNRSQLRDMHLLLLEEGHCFRDQALSFCRSQPAMPRHGLDGSSLATLVQMVGAGIGVTMIPEMAREVETRSADVSCSAFPDPQPRRNIGMIWRRSNPLAPQLETLAQKVQHNWCAQG